MRVTAGPFNLDALNQAVFTWVERNYSMIGSQIPLVHQ
jgi:hypothetical protein